MSLISKIYDKGQGPTKRETFSLSAIGQWPDEWFLSPDQISGRQIDRAVSYRGPRYERPKVQAPTDSRYSILTDMEVQAFCAACFVGTSSVPCCPATVTDQRGEFRRRGGETKRPKLYDLTGLPIQRVSGTCVVQPTPRKAIRSLNDRT